MNKCSDCDHELIYCPADWPFSEDYWVCSECLLIQICSLQDLNIDDTSIKAAARS